MYTISLVNQKGGGGKSTICQNLAVAAYQDGKTVAILDIDTQGSTYSWGKRRKQETEKRGWDPDPIVISVTIANLADEWQRVKEAGADYVFIDTPARLSAEIAEAARLSDLVLIPCKATIKDLERVVPSIKLSNLEGERPTCVVLNAVRPQGTRADEAAEYIQRSKFPVCSIRVGNFVAFEDADTIGLTPLETEPKGRAAECIQKLYKYTSALVEQWTSEKEKKHGQTAIAS